MSYNMTTAENRKQSGGHPIGVEVSIRGMSERATQLIRVAFNKSDLAKRRGDVEGPEMYLDAANNYISFAEQLGIIDPQVSNRLRLDFVNKSDENS